MSGKFRFSSQSAAGAATHGMHDASQRVRALTAMAAAGEPNVLQPWSARTQSHAVRVFMATDFEKLPTWRERAVRGMPRVATRDRCAAAIHVISGI